MSTFLICRDWGQEPVAYELARIAEVKTCYLLEWLRLWERPTKRLMNLLKPIGKKPEVVFEFK